MTKQKNYKKKKEFLSYMRGQQSRTYELLSKNLDYFIKWKGGNEKIIVMARLNGKEQTD